MDTKSHNRELLHMVEGIANKKKLAMQDVFSLLEESISLATLRRNGMDLKVSINQQNGSFTYHRQWLVVSDNTEYIDEENKIPFDSRYHIYQSDIKNDKTNEINTYIEKPLEDFDLSRIAINSVRQIIAKKINELENDNIINEYSNKVNDVVYCTVKYVENNNIIVDINNNAEGIIYRKDCIPNESVRKNDRIRAYVRSVKKTPKGYQISLSRSANELLQKLFSIEVPEILEGAIEIKGCVREPGQNAKIAVYTENPVIDPIGSCIGVRGSRIQSVSNELNGERINIVLWNSEPQKYIKNALHPASISSIDINKETNTVKLVVDESQISQIIGLNGQNIRLASNLTGWKLDVLTPDKAVENKIKEINQAELALEEDLNIDKKIASLLVANSFTNIDTLADAKIENFTDISSSDKQNIAEAIEKAQDKLFDNMLSDNKSIELLTKIEGVDESLAKELIKNDIKDTSDLANLSTDELINIKKIDSKIAESIIIEARAPWFEKNEK